MTAKRALWSRRWLLVLLSLTLALVTMLGFALVLSLGREPRLAWAQGPTDDPRSRERVKEYTDGGPVPFASSGQPGPIWAPGQNRVSPSQPSQRQDEPVPMEATASGRHLAPPLVHGQRMPAAEPDLLSPAPAPLPGEKTPSEAAWAKIHPRLKAKLRPLQGKKRALAAKAEVEILARVKAGTDVSQYMTWSLTRPFVDPLGRQAVVGGIKLATLLKLASLPEVSYIQPLESMVDPPRPPDEDVRRTRGAIQKRKVGLKPGGGGGPHPTGWWDVGDGHRSSAAWAKGFTGQGVKVMVNDSGTDFAHPDLQGTWAIITDPDSPYFGWPEIFDSYSMYLWALDSYEGTTSIADGRGDYADTSAVCMAGEPCVYQPIHATEAHTYTLTGTSVSGEYHIGSHPDKALADMVNGDWDGIAESEERVAILVVDESSAGAYDTVYVDLNGNFDFTDDKPVTRDDPISWMDDWDSAADAPGSDGYADVSGGLVYFIADGVNPIPASDWMWGLGVVGNGIQDFGEPDNGSLVAFALNDPTEPAGDHGQLTASAVAGQGVIDGGALPWKPAGDGTPFTGLVQGAGRDVGLTVNGNFYMTPFPEDSFLFSAFGYDGESGTGDDIQIVSNSWGNSGIDNDGWDGESRLIDAIVRSLNPTLSTLFSTGNGAAGYGTLTSPSPPTGINVGASTQYGSTGTFDSITSTEQINWGDVMSWSNRGPGARGDAGVDITANGAWGAGSLSLNEWGDGWTAWTSWGGTSRSSPVAAGNLALVYDAYAQANGTWPDYATARAILKAGADNQHYETFVQGAGSVNADRATDVAAGLGSIYTVPDSWTAGDYRGTEYPGFANILHPGYSSTKTFTVYNTGGADATVALFTDRLVKIGEYSFDFTSQDQSLEDGAFEKPDYIFWITDQVPAGTDLMEVKVVFPFDEFDPDGDYNLNQRWRVHVQDWMDVNGDGDLWIDLNGDGVVNWDEIDAGEYIRFTYGYNSGTALQARVKQPLERMHNGIFISLRHRDRTTEIPVTHMRFQVNFYQHSSFPWLSLTPNPLTVPAGGTATFTATMDIPAGAPYGLYNGAILVDDGTHQSAVPVVANVAADSTDFTFGGTPPADTPYDNGRVFGYFDWSWRAESGDWRFFFTDLPDGIPDGTMLLVDTQWENPETDIDALVMGPTGDDFSNNPGDFFYDPGYYGPYTLETLGGSANTYMGSGKWRWETSTGGPREIVAVEARSGLNLIALHNVLYAGADTAEPFTGTVGTIRVTPSPIDITTQTDSGSVQVTVQSSLALDDLAVEGWGLGAPQSFTDQTVNQDDPGDPATASYTRTVTINHAALLEVWTGNSSGNDLDLYLYDPDGNLAGVSTTPSDEEYVSVEFPQDGVWTIAVHGWSVPAGTATFDLTVNAVQGFDLTVTDLPVGPFAPDELITFTLNYNRAMNPGETWQGLLTVGPGAAPGVVKVPVVIRVPFARVNRSHDWVEGMVNPDSPVTVTVLAPDMTPKGGEETWSDGDGWFWAGDIWDDGGNRVDIHSGDTVLVESPGIDPISIFVPAMWVDVESNTNEVYGNVPGAPESSPVRVEPWFSGGPPTQETTTDVAGDWGVSFAPFDVLPGHTFGIWYTNPDGNEVGTVARDLRLDANLTYDWLWGHTRSGSGITVTLWSEAGEVKDVQSPGADEDGYFWVGFEADVVISDTIEVETDSDYGTLLLGNLTASANPDTDDVCGTTPPEHYLQVSMWGHDDGWWDKLWSDADGNWCVNTQPDFDILPGDRGSAWYQNADANWVGVGFAGPQVQVHFRNYDWVQGWAPPNALVDITLKDGLDQVKGTYSDWADAGGWFGGWCILDGDGNCVDIAPGDTVEVAFDGSDSIIVPVTDITGTLDSTANTITGQILADALPAHGWADIWWTREYAGQDFTTDAAGNFTVDFSPYDVKPGHWVNIWHTNPDGNLLGAVFSELRLDVNVSYDDIWGITGPGRAVTMTLRAPDNSVKEQATDTANNDGQFWVDFSEDIAPGDTVEAMANPSTSVYIEHVTIDVDVDADTICGTAPPDAWLQVGIHGGSWWDLAADESGNYCADFSGEYDIRPSDTGEVSYESPEGHRLHYGFNVPFVRVNQSHDWVQGSVQPNVPVTATLLAPDSTVKGIGTTWSGGDGWFHTDFWDEWGNRADIQVYDTVQVEAGDSFFDVFVIPVTGDVDPAADTVCGQMSDSVFPAPFFVDIWGVGGDTHREGTTDEFGNYCADYSGSLDIRDGHEAFVVYINPDGNQVGIVRSWLRLGVGVTGNWLDVSTAPGVDITATLWSAGYGEVKDTQYDTADDDGRAVPGFDADIQPGNIVELQADGRFVNLDVVNLSADGDADTDTVSGTAPLDTYVEAYIWGHGGGAWGETTSDAAGNWSIYFGDQFDILPGDEGRAWTYHADGHWFQVDFTVPYATEPVISEVRTTNVRDTSLTISWLTDVQATGEVHYGTDPADLNQIAYDDRGVATFDDTHYVTLLDLAPETTYYFDVVSGPTIDDSGGAHHNVTTGPTLGLPAPDTIYGQVFKEDGTTPAEGSIVYIELSDADGSGSPGRAAPLSALVNDTGYWSANLGNARTADLSGYFSYSASGDQVWLEAKGAADGLGCQRVDTADDSPAADIVLNVSACTATWPMDIEGGWNHISLPLDPITPYTAEGVCDEINTQGGDVVEIDRWHASGWDGHICGLPFNDFPITLGSDYFIRSNTASTWTIEGDPVATPVPLDLQNGWNSIGVPHTDAYTAETLCDEIIAQGVTALEIDRWWASGWDGHICGLPFNDFPIEIGVGYFVKTGSAGIVTPSGLPSLSQEPEPASAAVPEVVPASSPSEAGGQKVAVRDLRISNLQDTSVTLSWITDSPTTGYVVFSKPSTLGHVAYDVRGPTAAGDTHYVVLSGLEPETTYHFDIISGNTVVDNGGDHYTVTTGSTLESLPASNTVYGQVFQTDEVTPAAGAIVYLTLQDADGRDSTGQALLVSALADERGYWHANLGNARLADGSGYFAYSTVGDLVTLVARDAEVGFVTQTLDTGDLRPAAPLILGRRLRPYPSSIGR